MASPLDDSHTTVMGLWTDASQYMRAAKVLNAQDEFEHSQVLYYLIGHALELAFKSYIRSQGGTLEQLIKLRHDLVRAEKRANELGLSDLVSISTQEKSCLCLLNSYYKDKEFEYRVTGFRTYPPSKDLIELVNKILKKTKVACRAALD